MGRKPSTAEGATLTPLMFQILLAVSEGRRHGYAISQEIDARTGGAFPIGAGTLYRAIKQLVDAAFLVEVCPDEQVHRQRRYYEITPEGRERAAQEARVFSGIAAWAHEAIGSAGG